MVDIKKGLKRYAKAVVPGLYVADAAKDALQGRNGSPIQTSNQPGYGAYTGDFGADPISAFTSGEVGNLVGGGGAAPAAGTTGGQITGGAAVDPAAAKAAADQAKAAALRGDVTNLVQSVKNIFQSRYGLIDKAAAEQAGKLEKRFGEESGDVTEQVTSENNTAGASFAGRGTRDSSDYGNTVDTIKAGGEKQIRDLGTELAENKGKIGAYAEGEKTKLRAEGNGYDNVVAHLAESTDPAELQSIRNTIESRLAALNAGEGAAATEAQNISALNTIAPATARGVQLQTTLAKVIGGNAEPAVKNAIGAALISQSGLSADEQQKFLQGFQTDLSGSDTKKEPTQ